MTGLGETFLPDLFTGTGNLWCHFAAGGSASVQPQVVLGYSTGNGGGAFGLGWAREPARRDT